MPTRNTFLAAFQNVVNSSKSSSCTEIWIRYRDVDGDEHSGRDTAIVPVGFV